MRITAAAIIALLTCCALAGCKSGPKAEWEATEWGEARATMPATQQISVDPVVMPTKFDGIVPSSDWQQTMPKSGAAEIAEGINDADGKLAATTQRGGDAVLSVTVIRLYNGDGGGHFMGANEQADMDVSAELRSRDGRLIVKLKGVARRIARSGSQFDGLCYQLGEEFKTWFEGHR